MFKNHPKGLIVAFFANMGERFGFYTMMAILVLFLQAKYGVNAETAGSIYSWFYFAIYALALLGGILADATKKYKAVILAGIIIMFFGYVMMAIPGLPLTLTVIFLLTIALGNGLFKGNLQAVVGQMYDNPKYSALRDKAFLIFYMGINVGAFFAPFAATAVRNWWLNLHGFAHDGSLPAMCHLMISGKLTHSARFAELANTVSLNGPVTDLDKFAREYIDVFAHGYNYAFAIAAVAMLISMMVYILFSKHLPNKEVSAAAKENKVEYGISRMGIALGAMAFVTLGVYFIFGNIDIGFAFGLFAGFVTWILQVSTKDERPRVTALLLVFVVVIFFWMSFHQNGLTQTIFARDYTVQAVGPFTFLFFRLDYILAFIGASCRIGDSYKEKIRNQAQGIGCNAVCGPWLPYLLLLQQGRCSECHCS
jgi:proton-dependent oligopeptide transporter, POT family